MKIAIDTITDGANYGNRLQNYALQTVLQDNGFEVETLRRKTSMDLTGTRRILQIFKNCIKKCLGKECYGGGKSYKKRKKRFKDFNQAHINFSPYILKMNQAPAGLNDAYDYFICGSDQVWNAKIKIVEEDLKNYLACFAEPQKRIAYAASFGTAEISPEHVNLFQKELSCFKAISVRESAGKKLVEQMCRKEAQVVLDPTMLLHAKQWSTLASKPSYISEQKYILTYFLGGRSEVMQKFIDGLAEKQHCEIINLENEFLKEEKLNSLVQYLTTPDEFVWLISHSECVLTDSFHGTAFSILYQKPFVVFDRKNVEQGNNMGSRIDTLLGRFGLERFRDDIESPVITPEEYDGDQIEQVLDNDRKASMVYLAEALKSSMRIS